LPARRRRRRGSADPSVELSCDWRPILRRIEARLHIRSGDCRGAVSIADKPPPAWRARRMNR